MQLPNLKITMQSTYNLIKQFVTNKISYLRQPSLFTLQHAPNIKSNLHWLQGFKPTSVKDRVLFNSRYVRLFNYILTHYIRILTSSLFALCRSATCKKIKVLKVLSSFTMYAHSPIIIIYIFASQGWRSTVFLYSLNRKTTMDRASVF